MRPKLPARLARWTRLGRTGPSRTEPPHADPGPSQGPWRPEEWAGYNLRYVRYLRGEQARYVSATEAANAAGPLNQGEPPVGAVAYYTSNRPEGNIALAVGTRKVVTLDRRGKPYLTEYHDRLLGEYRGWSWGIGRP